MDYSEGKFNIGSTSSRDETRDFLSSGISLMGLCLLASENFEPDIDIPPHQLELGCQGDLGLNYLPRFFDSKGDPCVEPSYYLLRGREIQTSGEYWGSTHTPLFSVLN